LDAQRRREHALHDDMGRPAGPDAELGEPPVAGRSQDPGALSLRPAGQAMTAALKPFLPSEAGEVAPTPSQRGAGGVKGSSTGAHDPSGRCAATSPLRKPRWGGKRVAVILVAGGLLIVAAANAHLLYVAVTSQPDCVAHARPGEAASAGSYRAAQSACSPGV